ncbi:hypothetical protein PR048_008626 [Dryococelus australis]|uniref:Uncharacterized protein n=1 Tax=Dryococelus australis TaxID=614101 RepID=A0ABQ9HXY1_9NEOP|nr:hypothetical protein PR048_008626 [Dryococelus australis]
MDNAPRRPSSCPVSFTLTDLLHVAACTVKGRRHVKPTKILVQWRNSSVSSVLRHRETKDYMPGQTTPPSATANRVGFPARVGRVLEFEKRAGRCRYQYQLLERVEQRCRPELLNPAGKHTAGGSGVCNISLRGERPPVACALRRKLVAADCDPQNQPISKLPRLQLIMATTPGSIPSTFHSHENVVSSHIMQSFIKESSNLLKGSPPAHPPVQPDVWSCGTHTHSHTHARARAHTHTHTHTRTLSLSLSLSLARRDAVT